MKNTLLIVFFLSITFSSFSSKEDTIPLFNVFTVKDISVLNKTFKTKFIRTVNIYEFSDRNFNYLLNTLRRNKGKFHNLKITSNKLRGKYKKLLEFQIRKLSINSVSFKKPIIYPAWVADFDVTKLELILSDGDDISAVNFSKIENLTSLKIKGNYIDSIILAPISKIYYLDELSIRQDTSYNYNYILDSLPNLKNLSINLNKTPLSNLVNNDCLKYLTVYDANYAFLMHVDNLCFLKKLKVNTSLNIEEVMCVVEFQKCNPFISFFQKGYSTNKWIAKRKLVKPKRKRIKSKPRVQK